mmetsp:Transcript_33392/g.92376  ORF Transcript_33392/g.92376 Transcript_33392/m.92376 type:complete len:270 (-) Transcript_33392:419-1228(-)
MLAALGILGSPPATAPLLPVAGATPALMRDWRDRSTCRSSCVRESMIASSSNNLRARFLSGSLLELQGSTMFHRDSFAVARSSASRSVSSMARLASLTRSGSCRTCRASAFASCTTASICSAATTRSRKPHVTSSRMTSSYAHLAAPSRDASRQIASTNNPPTFSWMDWLEHKYATNLSAKRITASTTLSCCRMRTKRAPMSSCNEASNWYTHLATVLAISSSWSSWFSSSLENSWALNWIRSSRMVSEITSADSRETPVRTMPQLMTR